MRQAVSNKCVGMVHWSQFRLSDFIVVTIDPKLTCMSYTLAQFDKPKNGISFDTVRIHLALRI